MTTAAQPVQDQNQLTMRGIKPASMTSDHEGAPIDAMVTEDYGDTKHHVIDSVVFSDSHGVNVGPVERLAEVDPSPSSRPPHAVASLCPTDAFKRVLYDVFDGCSTALRATGVPEFFIRMFLADFILWNNLYKDGLWRRQEEGILRLPSIRLASRAFDTPIEQRILRSHPVVSRSLARPFLCTIVLFLSLKATRSSV